MIPNHLRRRAVAPPVAVLMALALVAGCSDSSTSVSSDPTLAVASSATTDDSVDATSGDSTPGTSAGTSSASTAAGTSVASTCVEIAATFVTRGSANADLPDPTVSATCDGDTVVVTSNGIPDFTYVETSPGSPGENNAEYLLPATPVVADQTTAVALLGAVAIAINGVPIFGPTEGQGGDVLATAGLLSECGGHNGPTGYHFHLLGTSSTTDCLYSPDAVATGVTLVGWAFDGYPIYASGDRSTSSYQLTDDSLFATDTWAAHTYVEGSGDLDECNGRTDESGNYAYYATSTFPYTVGCYRGVVDPDVAAGEGAPGGNAGGPPNGSGPPPPGGG
jgi:hypothetical protein